MRKLNQRGSVGLIIALVVFIMLFLGAAGFGAWAFMSRQDFKNNVDPKIAQAVEVAKKQTESAKDNEFVEKEKQPFRDYKGPATYGSITVTFPKTWSAQVTEAQSGSPTPIDGYFHPGFVPGPLANVGFAVRLQVTQTSYDQELQKFDGQTKAGTVKVVPFRAAKVPDTLGVRLDGEVVPKKQGQMILLPLRDRTLKIWTESDQFFGDFNNIILPNFTFIP